MALSVLAVVVAVSVLWIARPHCTHEDEDGRSLLVWETHDGRVCGYCPECDHVTRGWAMTRAALRWWE